MKHNIPLSNTDVLHIKCHGELSGYEPWRVTSDDEWLWIMYRTPEEIEMYPKGAPHTCDLNIWYNDLEHRWQWAIYPLKKVNGAMQTDCSRILACGEATVVSEPNEWLTNIYES